MTIYFISGLGADRSAFRNLVFPEGTPIVYLDWIKPYPSEALEAYAERLADNIDGSKPFSLLGLSMGGMIAVEVAKIIRPNKIAIISSAATYKEIPFYFRMPAKIGLHKIIPYGLTPHVKNMIYWFMGAGAQEKEAVVDRYIKKMDVEFVKWSIEAILNWKNEVRPQNLLHIHGTRDKLLPFGFTRADIGIEGGGHLIIHNRAKEISAILTDYFGLK